MWSLASQCKSSTRNGKQRVSEEKGILNNYAYLHIIVQRVVEIYFTELLFDQSEQTGLNYYLTQCI